MLEEEEALAGTGVTAGQRWAALGLRSAAGSRAHMERGTLLAVTRTCRTKHRLLDKSARQKRAWRRTSWS
eukprot:4205435-Amphidinium_carterae.1